MRFFFYISILISISLSSCLQHNISSDEADDVYFIKKDIIPIEEDENEEIKVLTEVEEVK